MNEKEIVPIKNVVRETIKETVNGKIDKLSKDVTALTQEIVSLRQAQESQSQKFDNHMKDVDFVIENKDDIKHFIVGIRGVGLLRGALVWIAVSITAIIGAIISIKSLIK